MGEPTERTARLALAGILVVGLSVRLWGITFGLPHVLARPDELFILGISIRMHQGFANPNMFDYPSLYLYLVAGLFSLYYGWGRVTGRFATHAAFLDAFRTNWTPFFLIPRLVNAALGTATAGVVYAIASLLFNRLTGIVAAFFMALAFLHVRDSHYATTDIPLTLFVMCAVLAAVRVHRSRSARDAWLAGIFAGMATGIKYNAAPVVVPLAAVEILHALSLGADWRRALRETHLWRMALATAALFALTSPYIFLDYANAFAQMRALAEQSSTGMTPRDMLGNGWQYHVPVSLRYGLGLPLLAFGLGGLLWMGVRQPAAAVILGSFPLVYYAAAGASYNVFVRYMIPVVPFLCITAAYAVDAVSVVASGKLRLPRIAVAAALSVLILIPSVSSIVRFDWLLAQEDSRLVAARWVHEQVPPGASIYASGNPYGHPQLTPPDGKYRLFGWDWRAERFTLRERINGVPRERLSDELPTVIVVQKSAIPYSHVPPPVAALAARDYELVHVIRAANLEERGNVYDVQDGFYAPFAGFKDVRRPGPNFEIYRRRR